MAKQLIAIMAVLMISFSVVAEEHPLSTIQGTGIDLKNYDHAFAGSVDDFVVWGFLDEPTFTSELIVRKYGQTIKTTFSRGENTIGGNIAYKVEEQDRNIEITVLGVDPQERIIKLAIAGEAVNVKIEGDYANGHFINPHFSTMMNGREINYTLEGEACFGMSMHYAMMILGAMSI